MNITKFLKSLMLPLLLFLFMISCQQPVDPVTGNNGDDRKTGAPSFSIAPGTYITPQTLSLSSQTGGATIYYSIGGAPYEPYSSANPIDLPGYGQLYEITAYAEAAGKEQSDTVSGTFNITGTLKLNFSVDNSADVDAGLEYPKIRLYCTALGDDSVIVDDNTTYIQYTENGFDPQKIPNSIHYTGTPFSFGDPNSHIFLTDSLVIKAIAYKEGWATSGITELSHPLQLKDPIFVPGDTEPVTKQTLLYIESPNSGASISYKKVGFSETLTDATADIGSTTIPFTITEPSRVKAYTTKPNWKDSKVVMINYRLKLPKVQFNPPPVAGTIHTTTLNVEMSCPISPPINNLRIKYTINGGDPSSDPAAQDYIPGASAPIEISRSTVIKAFAYIAGDMEGHTNGWYRSDVAEAVYNYEIKCPYTDKPGATFFNSQDLTLATDTANVDIYYLITSDPSADLNKTTGTKYENIAFPFDPSVLGDTSTDIQGRLYLKAKAYRPDSTSDSSIELIESYLFKLREPGVPNYTDAQQAAFNITLTHTQPDATIRYSDDPAIQPSIDVTTDKVLTIDKTMTITAIAVKKNWHQSEPVSRTYTLKPMKPIFYDPSNDVNGGLHRKEIKLTAFDPNGDATIFFTRDGSDPADPQNQQREQIFDGDFIDIKRTTTLRAVCFKTGWTYSDPVEQTYTLKVKEPTYNLPAGGYDSQQTVTMTSHTPNSEVFYTTDGSDPDLELTTPFTTSHDTDIVQNTKLRMIAKRTGWTSSDEVVVDYTIKLPMPVCDLTLNSAIAPNLISSDVVSDPTADTVTHTYIYEANDVPLGTFKFNYSTGGAYIKYSNDGVTVPDTTIGGPGTLYNLNTKPSYPVDEAGALIQAVAFSTGGNFSSSSMNLTQYKYKVKQPSFGGAGVGPATNQLYEGGALSNVAAGNMQITGNEIRLTSTTVGSIIHYQVIDAGNTTLKDATCDTNATITLPEIDGISSFTIKMIAKRDGWIDSNEKAAKFYRQLEKPVIESDLDSNPSVKETSAQISMRYPDAALGGVTIHFLSGSTNPAGLPPITNATKYGSALTAVTTTYYKARAAKEGWLVSDVAEKNVQKCRITGYSNTAFNFNYISSNRAITVNASSGGAGTLHYSYNGGSTFNAGASTFQVNKNISYDLQVGAPGCIVSDPAPTRSYRVKLNVPNFNVAATTPILYSSRTITVAPASVRPTGSQILYSITGGAPTSGVGGANTITLSTNTTTTVKLLTRATGYDDSTTVERTYQLKLDKPIYIATDNLGGPPAGVTGRRLTFKLPSSYPNGSVIEFSTNNSNYVSASAVSGSNFYFDIGLNATTVYARVTRNGYIKSDYVFKTVPAN